MLALAVSKDIQERTNAVFLAGAYMIMRLDSDLESVKTAFAPLHGRVVPYRDVSPGKPNFDLHVQDCWGGLARAKGLGWVSFHAKGFDLEEYMHFDSPLEADLHEIIPGKLVAMRGPVEIPDEMLWTDVNTKDNVFSHRDFSPAHYVDILRQFDVQVVVRLNEPRYSKDAFTRAGIAVADLFFPDCTVPPMDVVAKFLLIAEKVPGAVAVHCKAGLGRTGTLIGLYLMKHHGFSAREALGWLRIVRPGSVIGPQQGFLCELEGLMRRHGALHRRPGGVRAVVSALPAGAGVGEVEGLIAEVHRIVDGRAGAMGVGPSPPEPSDPAVVELAGHVSEAAARRVGRRLDHFASPPRASRPRQRLPLFLFWPVIDGQVC